MLITPKKWSDFQHYKHRSPPWIRLHKNILDNYEFQSLPDASKALAMSLWLIASEHEDAIIDATPEKLAFRLRSDAKKISESLTHLIHSGFFICLDDASNMLADCEQSANTEKRREETETETETETEKKAQHLKIFVLPNWIDEDVWNLWMKTRKGRKMIPEQMQAQINKLSSWRDKGIDYSLALKNSAEAGWSGLFEPSAHSNGFKTAQQQRDLNNKNSSAEAIALLTSKQEKEIRND